jgi:HK97 family phage prohead protease
MAKLKYIRAFADVKALSKKDKEEGVLRGVIGSDETVDRYGEIIDSQSWQLEHYQKNPVLLWAHNLTFGEDRPPIGKSIRTWVENKQLKFDLKYDLADPFAADIYRKYLEGFLTMFSVGFIPHRVERVDDESQPKLRAILKDNELLELSAVPVPANPNAGAQLAMRSFKTKTWDKMVKEAEDDDHEEPVEEPTTTDPEPTETPDPTPAPTETPEATDDQTEKIADRVIEKIAPQLTKTITDVVSTAQKAVSEDGGGSGNDPKTPQQGGGNQKLARVMRETTKMLQGALAEYNRSLRK